MTRFQNNPIKNKQRISISVSPKSLPLAFVLTIVFGPLGLLYCTIPGAVLMFLVTFIVGLLTLGFGFLYTWPICIFWAYVSVKKYNSKIIEEEI